MIGWEEFRKSKWLIGYTVVLSVSIIDWVLSVSMVCDEVRLPSVILVEKEKLEIYSMVATVEKSVGQYKTK